MRFKQTTLASHTPKLMKSAILVAAGNPTVVRAIPYAQRELGEHG
jgi:hypothetical protein